VEPSGPPSAGARGPDDRAGDRSPRGEEHEEEGRYRSEFRYGSLVRRLPLPAGASEDDVTATYRDGILEIRVPIAAAAETVARVPITRT
jgi:HSP20 family protein